jgi:hypothetical protein
VGAASRAQQGSAGGAARAAAWLSRNHSRSARSALGGGSGGARQLSDVAGPTCAGRVPPAPSSSAPSASSCTRAPWLPGARAWLPRRACACASPVCVYARPASL